MQFFRLSMWAMFVGLVVPGIVLGETATATNYAAGNGTQGDPYQISTLAELRLLSESPTDWVADMHFVLVADIDASDTKTWNVGDHDADGGTTPNETMGFSPIGEDTNEFYGSFDGQGFVIENLWINRPGYDYTAMFGYAAQGSEILNVGLMDCAILGRDHTGALVGYNEQSTTTWCFMTGRVSGEVDVGGLIGFNNLSTVVSCSANAIVEADYNAGCFVGLANNDSIENCYGIGTVTANNYSGGFFGAKYGGGVSNSYSSAVVNAASNVGGFGGFHIGSTFEWCYFDSDTSGDISEDEATALNTVEMRTQSSFIGFDFVANPDWVIADGHTFPYLPWQPSTIQTYHVYVDFDNGGTVQNGSYTTPYVSMAAGVSNSPSGGRLIVKSGNSAEQLTISTPMQITSMTYVRIGG